MIIDHVLIQTCEIIQSSVNVYGDQLYTSKASVKCRFRYITNLNRTGGREEIDADAMLWLEADANVSEGTLIKFDNKYYRIERIIKAMKLTSSTIEFLKCELQRHTQISEVS